MAKLKVYVTPIGFHDAYVAAPSQQAALKAWGSDANLFARGVAAVVTDPKLMKAPLAKPGEVIKVARGTAAEHLAALPKAKKAAAKAKGAPPAQPARAVPRPKRDKLDAAEAALAELEDAQRSERRALDRRIDELRRERDGLEKTQAAAREKLTAARDRAEAAYDRALEKWRG